MPISYSEAYDASLKYFCGSELAAKTFVDKYALRDIDENILESTPREMHGRIASEIARIEASKFAKPLTYDEIFALLDRFRKLIPQGSILSGVGSDSYQTLSNCYVTNPPLDSYGGIHYTDEQISQISKRRGGVGMHLNNLRPAGLHTANSSRTTSGIIPFAERMSNSIREVGQNGRRGALMLTLSVHHPQVLDFARAKLDEVSITGANISIQLTDEFLSAVHNNAEYEQRWPLEGVPTITKMVKARDVWNEIIKCAWTRAEPGLLFWDNILRESPADCYSAFGFATISTNPCSELPLSLLDSCRLLVINLMAYVKNPFSKTAYFDYKEFYEDAQIAQRILDDIVDLEIEYIKRILAKIERDPEPEYVKRNERELWTKVLETCQNGRRTGLGITALGDCIASLGLKYGSDDSIAVVDRIYKTLKFGSYRSSVDMAKELGAFPVWNWELEKNNPFINRIKNEEILLLCNTECGVCDECNVVEGKKLYADIQKYGRRNIANLTTAPAGSISILALMLDGKSYCLDDVFGTSSGIEPAIFLEYLRNKKITHNDKNSRVDFVDDKGDKWQQFPVYHDGYRVWKLLQRSDLFTTQYLHIVENPYAGATAEEIDWVQRVKLQAAAQKHVDHSISSTINLPENVSVEKVAEIYEASWKAGLKGITVYRKNCRTGVLVEKGKNNPKEKNVKRPKELECSVHHIKVKGKEYFVLVGLRDGAPYEVFAGRNGFISNKVKRGKIVKVRKHYKAIFDDETELVPITATTEESEEAITRLTSTSLRYGADIESIVDQLEKVNGDMTSFAKSVARALKHYIKDGEVKGEVCPECNGQIVREEGCKKCVSCGMSKCS